MHDIPHKMKFRAVMMDPVTAQALLDKLHPRQRGKKAHVISKCLGDMLCGYWELTWECVAIDEDGLTVDGQNRLSAIIRSGKPQPIMLVTNCPRTAILRVDQGANRNIGDTAKMAGTPLPHGAAAYAGVAYRMMLGTKTGGNYVVSIPQRLAFIEAHKEALEFAFACTPIHKKGITQAPVRAVLARAWYRRNTRTRIKEFAEILFSGLVTNPREDSAAIRLRNWLQDVFASKEEKKAGVRYPPHVVYAKTESALSYFLQREPMEKLYESKTELFPLEDDEPEEVEEKAAS